MALKHGFGRLDLSWGAGCSAAEMVQGGKNNLLREQDYYPPGIIEAGHLETEKRGR